MKKTNQRLFMPTKKLKLDPLNPICSLFLMCIVAGLVTGCATNSYDRGAHASAALQTSANQSAALSSAITASIDALSTLEFQTRGDLRNNYVKFSTSVKTLKAENSRMDSAVAKAQAQAKAYLNNWRQRSSDIQNRTIRSISSQQRQDISNKAASVDKDYSELKENFQPFMADLTGIKTYLGTDLTMDGLRAIKTEITKTKADAAPLRKSLRKLQSGLTSLGADMSPIVAAESQ